MKEIPHPIREVVGAESTLNPSQKYRLREYDDLIERTGAKTLPELWKIREQQAIRKRNEQNK